MKRFLKWGSIALAVLVGLAAVTAVALFVFGGARLNRSWDVPVAAVVVPTDEESIARGRHLVESIALCSACHSSDLGGELLFEEPGIASVYASNLTAGRGGVGGMYSDADFVRAIRHGINADGRGLMIMHSDAYNGMGLEDLGAVIAYVRSVPPVDRELPSRKTEPLGRVMVALGLFDTENMPLIPAEIIDHERPIPAVPPRGVTAEYGSYLASLALCAMCHGRELTGGPPVEPGAPLPPNIAAYAAPGGWSEEQFIRTIRTGATPYGKALDPAHMPWNVYSGMTDDELAAIWRYIGSVASQEFRASS